MNYALNIESLPSLDGTERDPLFSSDLEASARTCRICFESDGSDVNNPSDDVWIVPCKCTGSQKWVHTKCLEKWRLTSQKPSALTQCPTCKYDYKFRNSGYENTCIDNICNKLAANRIAWFTLSELSIFIITILCEYFMPSGKFSFRFMFKGTREELDGIQFAIWLLTITAIFSALHLIFFIVSFISIRKKLLYLVWFFRYAAFQVFVMTVMTVLSYYVNLIIMTLLINLIIAMIIHNYVGFIIRLDRDTKVIIVPYV